MNIREIIEKLKSAEQGGNGMFQIGDEEMCALVSILEPMCTKPPVAWWTGAEPEGELESIHDHETGSHGIPLYPIEFKYVPYSTDPYICPHCGGMGWSASCDKCIPY